jgi:hypothetical protein
MGFGVEPQVDPRVGVPDNVELRPARINPHTEVPSLTAILALIRDQEMFFR